MENIFKRMFKNSNEATKSSETIKSPEQQLDPEKQKYIDNLKKYIYCSSCDGNLALERQLWIDDNHININLESYVYYSLSGADPKKYFAMKQLIDSFYNNNFDINLIKGNVRKPIRDPILGLKNIDWEYIQKKAILLQKIREGKLNDFDERKIKKIIGKNEFERVLKITDSELEIERLRLEKEQRASRLKEFQESGKDKDPLMASDVNFSLLDIHSNGSNSKNPPILGLQSEFPENLVNLSINVKQIEGIHSKERYNDKEYENGGFFDIADTSGFLPPKAIEKIVEKDKKSVVVIYGGHLKLCFGSAFRQILEASSSNSPKAIDIHVPLDKCYDIADSQTDGYKLSIIPYDSSQFELYKDGEIIKVDKNVKPENPRSRIYLWSDTSKMLEVINTQHRLDEVRKKINVKE